MILMVALGRPSGNISNALDQPMTQRDSSLNATLTTLPTGSPRFRKA